MTGEEPAATTEKTNHEAGDGGKGSTTSPEPRIDTGERPTFRAEVRQVTGLTMAGKAGSNHWVILDGNRKFGGSEAGASPMELLLIAVGGCTGMDVISILNKMRVRFSDFRVELEAEKADEHPKVYTVIRIIYHLSGGDIPLEKVEKAVRLSQERYCAVTIMMRQSVRVEYEILIHDEGNAE